MKRGGRHIDPVLMLEPPTPAGEPFATVEENRTTGDFESVCISLVERGWKIMPKKGTYPINKKGPRYINLVDPRGNRKSVRVIDQALWEKLRAAESRRTGQKNEEEPQKESTLVENSMPETPVEPVVASFETQECSPNVVVSEPVVTSEVEVHPVIEQVLPEPTPQLTEIAEIPAPKTEKAEIVENPPREFQNFALSSPGLQKSIFDLGFETLLKVLQNETLSPGEIVSKIQEWSLESKNLLEFVHKSQDRGQEALPDTAEKDELISELQATLKETEDKLAETIESLREI